MKFGYGTPVYGGILRNVEHENTPATDLIPLIRDESGAAVVDSVQMEA